MAEKFEVIFSAMLVIAFAVFCYLSGKGKLFELVPKMLLERLEEINKKHGEWIADRSPVEVEFRCSECGYSYIEADSYQNCDYNYCPNCGAKMDGDNK